MISSSVLKDPFKVRLLTAAVSLLLSIFAFWQTDVVGRDGIIYLETARGFIEGGVAEAFELFPWPFYSISIGWVHALTGLPFEQAGYFLNSLLILLITDTFIRLYREINPMSQFIWLPAIVILAFSGLNDYRIEIVHGWGFLAFSLLAFLHFFRFFNSRQGRDALLWQLYIIVAALFRKEACAYMLLVPLIVFIQTQPGGQWKAYLKANLLLFFVFCAFIIGLLVFKNPFIEILYFALKAHLVGDNPLTTFMAFSSSMGQEVLTRYSDDYAPLMLLSGIFALIAYKIMAKLGLFYAAVTLVGVWKTVIPNECHKRFVLSLLLISFLIIVLFFSQTMVITGRYVLLSAIILLLFTTCYLEKWFELLNRRGFRQFVFLFVLPFVINLVVGMWHSGGSKAYMREAGHWVKANLPKNAVVLANESRLRFYSGDDVYFPMPNFDLEKGEALDSNTVRKHDYLLLREKKGEQLRIPYELLTRVKAFDNGKGEQAVLYKVIRIDG